MPAMDPIQILAERATAMRDLLNSLDKAYQEGDIADAGQTLIMARTYVEAVEKMHDDLVGKA